MNKLIELFGRFCIHGGWKKAEFYKKHNMFYRQGENCYISVYTPSRESYLILLGNNVWITHGVSLINHDASGQVVKRALNLPWVARRVR